MRILSSIGFRAMVTGLALCLLVSGLAAAQGDRPRSPRGSAATQIGDGWIDVDYGRPILRGRENIFGSGESYGQGVYAGAPVWRAGADVTTRIKSELDLEINGTKVPAGEYSFFIELKEGAWTAILSQQEYMEAPDRAKMAEGITWGAYGYSSDHDVLRAPMELQQNDVSIDQLTIVFVNVTAEGGTLAVAWADQVATLPFTVEK